MDRVLQACAVLSTVVVLIVGVEVFKSRSPSTSQIDGQLSNIVGRVGEPIAATELSGQEVNIKADRRALILVAFSTTCSYCRENMPAWLDLSVGCGVDVVLISNESMDLLKDYTAGMPFRRDSIEQRGSLRLVQANAWDDFILKYSIVGTPDHIFIDEDGIVSNRRVGRLPYSELRASVVQAGGECFAFDDSETM